MKGFKILLRFAAFFALFVAALTSCRNTDNESRATVCSEILLDSYIDSYQDSISIDPYAVLEIFKNKREKTADSISSYKLLQSIALCYQWAGDLDSSMLLLREIMDFCRRAQPSPCLILLQAETYLRYGSCWADFREHDSALFYYKKTSELINNSIGRDLFLSVYLFSAVSHEGKGDLSQASHYYRRALFIADSLNNATNTTRFVIFLSLAKLYTDIENFEMAENYFQQAEKYRGEIVNAHRLLYYNFRGVYYMKMKNYPKALEVHRQFYRENLSNPVLQSFNCAIGAANIGEMFLRMEQSDSARYYINRAREYYERSYQYPTFEFHIDGLSAMLALQENRLDEAEKLLARQMMHDKSSIDASIYYLHLQLPDELYAKKNDFKNAYEYRLKADIINDSLRNTQVRNNIAEMEMRFRQDTTLLRKDLRIAVVEGRAAQWQNIALISLLSLMLIAILAVGFVFYTRRKREQEYRRQMATVTELRMQIVRNRLSPHFVFNALNVMMPSIERHKELEQHFKLLVHLLRNNLIASEQISTPLNDEINLVKNYLQLQDLSNPEKFSVAWHISDDAPKDVRIPSMSIQIPVENAVKYAFTSGQDDARIEIRITLEANFIHLIIEDNGVGYRAGAGAFDERGTGSGLKMLHRTVDLLNLRNRQKMLFKIENRRQIEPSANGTRVTVVVPTVFIFE